MLNSLVDKFEWRAIAIVLNSPFAKGIALIPLFGYLIIFNEEITSWLNKTVLSNWYFFTPIVKFRLVYYGGICIAAALLIYKAACPRALTKYASPEDALEAYFDGSKPKIVRDIVARHIVEARGTFKLTRIGESSRPIYITPNSEAFRILTDSVARYLHSIQAGSRSDSENKFESPTKYTQWFSTTDIETLNRLRDDAYRQHVRGSQNVEINELGAKIVETSYKMDQTRRRYLRVFTGVLAYAGLFCLLLPALETFIHVLLLDIPWIYF